MIKVLLAGATALLLAASPAFAQATRTISGTTVVELNKDLLPPLLNHATVKATVTVNGSAKLSKYSASPKTKWLLSLPVLGGTVDLTDADGEIIHTGGLKFSRLNGTVVTTVVFSAFMLEVKVSEPGVTPPVPPTPTYQITALASGLGSLSTAGSRIVLFELPAPVTKPPFVLKKAKLTVDGGALNLSATAATLLNTALGLPSVPAAPPAPASPSFTAGANFGKVLFQATTKKL